MADRPSGPTKAWEAYVEQMPHDERLAVMASLEKHKAAERKFLAECWRPEWKPRPQRKAHRRPRQVPINQKIELVQRFREWRKGPGAESKFFYRDR